MVSSGVLQVGSCKAVNIMGGSADWLQSLLLWVVCMGLSPHDVSMQGKDATSHPSISFHTPFLQCRILEIGWELIFFSKDGGTKGFCVHQKIDSPKKPNSTSLQEP